MATSSHYNNLAPLEPGDKPFQRHKSANDAATHRVSSLAKSSNKDELVASVEVVHRREQHHDLLQHRKKVAISIADPVTHYSQSSIEASSEFTFWSTSSAEIFKYNKQQPPTQLPPDQSPSTEKTGLFSFTKRHFRLPFSLSRSKRDLSTPEKEPSKSLPPGLRQKRSSLASSGRFSTSEKYEGAARKSANALAHNFKQITGNRFSMYQCEVCHKGFTGFMKQALRCTDCYIMVHRYCEERVPPCKAQIESGNYITMSRNKVVKKLRDLDRLSQFLLEKIATLSRGEQPGSLVDKVFRVALSEFHTSLISSYSLQLQNSVECSTESCREKASRSEEPRVYITFSQLVDNFSSIFIGIAKHEGLNDPCYISIGINHIKTLLDEFSKARYAERHLASECETSAFRRKSSFQRRLQRTVSKGQRFFPWQFKTTTTVCEYCSRPISQSDNGEVCEACGNACHEDCYKKSHKKNDGRRNSKSIPEYNPKPPASSLFGVPLTSLVPPGVIKVPPFLEQCFQFLENKGLYTEGVYRKSASVSSKKAVRTALEEDPENACLDAFSVDAVAAAVSGFFRELPEPLLTRQLCDEFIRATELTNKKEKLETLHRLIYLLPELNYAILERLLFHLARFAQHQDINKMGANNLAIIFAPCLFQPQEILKDLQKQIKCLEVIITEQVEKLTASLRSIRSLTSHARSKALKLTQLSKGDSCRKIPDKASFVNSLKEEERKRLASELEEIERERVELTVKLRKLEPFILLEDDSEQPDSGRRLLARKRVTVSGTASTTHNNASRYIVDGPDADQSSPLNSHSDNEEASISFMESTV